MNRLNLTCLLSLSILGIASPLCAQSPLPNVERSGPMVPNVALSTDGSWIGYLIDTESMEQNRAANLSDAESVKKPVKDLKAITSSSKSTFAFYNNGKFHLLDDSGNGEARKFIKQSWKNDGFYVLIKGAMQGGVIRVRHISDASDSPM